MYGEITAVKTRLFSAIYKSYNSIYNGRRGPPCRLPARI